MQDKILIRPMYSTDKGFIKGWMCAVLESNGDVIVRKDSVSGMKIPNEYSDLPVKYIEFDDVNWKLMGYDI